MEWKKYPENKPPKSGSYSVSVARPVNGNEFVFVYVAYYSANLDQWFKYDPFSDEHDVLESIEFKINGWLQLPVYT